MITPRPSRAASCEAFETWQESGEQDLDGISGESEPDGSGDSDDDRAPGRAPPASVAAIADAMAAGDRTAVDAAIDKAIGDAIGIAAEREAAEPDEAAAVPEGESVDAPRGDTRPPLVTAGAVLERGLPDEMDAADAADADGDAADADAADAADADAADTADATRQTVELQTLDAARQVGIGTTLAIQWDGDATYVAVVHHVTEEVDGHIAVLVDWDDGQLGEHTRVVLVGPAAVPWHFITDGSCTMSRQDKKSLNLFRGRLFNGVVPTCQYGQPGGVFAATLDSASLSARLNAKLRWDEVIWSTRLETGGPGMPKELDLVATFTESTVGHVRTPKDVYIVLGYANPVQTSNGPRANKEPMQLLSRAAPTKPNAAFLIGVGVGKFKERQHGIPFTKFQEGGRFLKDDQTYLPVDVLALDSTKLIHRRTESLHQLAATVGASLVADLRTRLLNWELLQEHRTRHSLENFCSKDSIFTYYCDLANRPRPVVSPTVLPRCTLILGKTMVKTYATKLATEHANLKAAYTAERQATAYANFNKTVEQVVAFLCAYPVISGVCDRFSSPIMVGFAEILGQLKPELAVTTHGSVQEQMLNARNEAEKRVGLRNKRPKDAAIGHTGNTPDGKKGDGKAVGRGSLRAAAAAAAAAAAKAAASSAAVAAPSSDRASSSAISDKSSSDPSRQLFTPLAEAQRASDLETLKTHASKLELRVRMLEGQLSKEEEAVLKLNKELAAERALSTLQKTELDALKTSVPDLQRQSGASEQKDETIRTLQAALTRLEKEKQTWQVMLGCQMNIDSAKFSTLMGAFGGGPGAGS